MNLINKFLIVIGLLTISMHAYSGEITDTYTTGDTLTTTTLDNIKDAVNDNNARINDLVNGQIYAIGDIGPAGGWVFYIEAALVDQSTDAIWGCFGTLIGDNRTWVGTGAKNTLDILAGCSDPGIAAEVADAYTLNAYSDWYLPSQDEQAT